MISPLANSAFRAFKVAFHANLVKLLEGKLSPGQLYSAYRPSKPMEIESAKIAEQQLAGKKLAMAKKDEAKEAAKAAKQAAKDAKGKKGAKAKKEAEVLADD
ncbi:MAG: hypothetical protein M3Q07_19780 [Pseudobdellovibrionaceae bacterium]|nr:hypothetical protein [Pseudobdellovibrionaceae bacterium]